MNQPGTRFPYVPPKATPIKDARRPANATERELDLVEWAYCRGLQQVIDLAETTPGIPSLVVARALVAGNARRQVLAEALKAYLHAHPR